MGKLTKNQKLAAEKIEAAQHPVYHRTKTRTCLPVP